MSRLPPALLYLTIYNPSLQPVGPSAGDDEDAAEQAQILFYTAREHAVSRDRMLRQVGLAKALASFSDIFAAEDVCESVHSQTRRMAMVSPEPGFWIHACVELAKTQRTQTASGAKGKSGKDKAADKGKAKATEPAEVVFDYHDGSISDSALRAHLLQAYELFVLTHGSFASILDTLGQQALELQLERFFTPWAWNWDIERDVEFGGYFGSPLHPLYRTIAPLLDDFLAQTPLADNSAPLLLCPPHIVPSDSYTAHHLPTSLPSYLLPRIPPRPPPPPSGPTITPPDEQPALADAELVRTGANALVDGTRDALNATGNAFVAVGSAMDVRRWNWPGYLTFGKNSRSPIPAEPPQEEEKDALANDASADGAPADDDGAQADSEVATTRASSLAPTLAIPEVSVDRESLFDAMSSLGVMPPGDEQEGETGATEEAGEDQTSVRPPTPIEAPEITSSEDTHLQDETLPIEDSEDSSAEESTGVAIEPTPAVEQLPPLSHLRLHLPDPNDAEVTVRRDVLYATHNGLGLAVVVPADIEFETADSENLARKARDLLEQAQKVLDDAASLDPSTPTYSATRILQPQDKYAVWTGDGSALTSAAFSSRSEHLFSARDLVAHPDVHEAYARTQGSGNWHVARREGAWAVFMEVMRKEMTLTDVENELLGVLRRYQNAL